VVDDGKFAFLDYRWSSWSVKTVDVYIARKHRSQLVNFVATRKHDRDVLCSMSWLVAKHANYRDSTNFEDCMSKFIRKAVAIEAGASSGVDFDPQFERDYPATLEYLTCRQLDGRARQTSTLSIFVQDGLWKAFLNERDQGLSLCVTAASWADLMPSLEESLNLPVIPWRTRLDDGTTTRKKK